MYEWYFFKRFAVRWDDVNDAPRIGIWCAWDWKVLFGVVIYLGSKELSFWVLAKAGYKNLFSEPTA